MKEKFRYKKEMGQNFIFDPVLIERLADAASIGPEDGVLEIGPGRGTLTAALSRRARKVIAVELDRTLLNFLEAAMAPYANVTIEAGDILRADLHALAAALGAPCRVAANLPYNITAPVVERLLTSRLPFLSFAVMVQKEVGEKMLAGPGDPGYGPLSLLVQYHTEARVALSVPAACFTPSPKVDSSFMLLTKRPVPAVSVRDEARLFRLIRAGFAMRRKTLVNNLMAALAMPREQALSMLRACGLPADVRGEALSLAAFARLAEGE